MEANLKSRDAILCNTLIFLRKSGAGEGIRALDPDLGRLRSIPRPFGGNARFLVGEENLMLSHTLVRARNRSRPKVPKKYPGPGTPGMPDRPGAKLQ